ncbi:site-specific DNA-methyltransferase [Hymenobacter sp. BT175]|uniref:site-specific DNA-methyltransferase n=1 Tax=Hymenobacter translucens TaxID=2886507 RepID=UPI001D0DE32D|nr:site-specific DNA-methyltransferase [Hymenobacter translucens]MCC2545471.1 site-specific DNA-methyltransferase [Hymenobacter translucens]
METLNDYLPTTPDLNAERLADLRRLWPDLFTNEGHPNPTALQAALSLTTPAAERYAFTWSGKTTARQNAFSPTTATLVPDEDRSFQPEKGRHAIIEGDNLQVLKLLLAGYRERVKCIYIDPPYNTGKDFVYPDNYTEGKVPYWEQTGGIQNGIRTDTNPDTNGRYHSDWLSMMYSRLLLARQLLRIDGYLVVSIDDAEMANLKRLLDDVFGEENFVASLVWDRNRKNDAKFFSVGHEYMIVYAKDKGYLKESGTVLRVDKEGVDEVRGLFEALRKEHKDNWEKVRLGLKAFFTELDDKDPRKPLARFTKVDQEGPYRDDGNISWPGGGGPTYEVLHPETKKACKQPSRGWVYGTPERFWQKYSEGVVVFGSDETTVPSIRTNLFDKTTQVMRSVDFSYAQTASQEFAKIFDGKKIFQNPKPISDIRRLVEYLTSEDDIVLDFFAGSGTTGHAVMQANGGRQFILVQLPECIKESKSAYKEGYRKISDITIERCRRAVAGYGSAPQPLETGFRVWRLEPSRFPAATFQPKPGQSADEQLAELKKYLADKRAALQLPFMDDDQPARVAEILLKNGFSLNYTLSEQLSEYTHNRIVRVTDQETNKTALLCLDDALTDATVQQLSHQPPAEKFITPERAFNTTAKWNLKMHLKDNLLAT